MCGCFISFFKSKTYLSGCKLRRKEQLAFVFTLHTCMVRPPLKGCFRFAGYRDCNRSSWTGQSLAWGQRTREIFFLSKLRSNSKLPSKYWQHLQNNPPCKPNSDGLSTANSDLTVLYVINCSFNGSASKGRRNIINHQAYIPVHTCRAVTVASAPLLKGQRNILSQIKGK